MKPSILRRALLKLATRPVFSDNRGIVSVETAIIGSVISILALGVVDFSMAYSRKSEMTNAVRAGVQFALVRRPSIGPSADEQASIISLETIRQAVIDSADFLENDPGTDDLSASVFCLCPNEQPVTCVSQPDVPLACSERQTFLEISFRNNYTPIFDYPLIPNPISLEATNSVRLN